MPVIGLVVLAIVQVAVVCAAQVATTSAAREAARRAIVEPDPAAARRAATAGLDGRRTVVEVVELPGPPRQVAVTVRSHVPTEVPIVGRLVRELDLEATAVMAREP
jgi:hypothetical protein